MADKFSEWGFIAHSQIGATHVRQNLPNQDACACSNLSGGATAILAVADGHGSTKSFRSQVGAKFAVQIAIDVCEEFLRTVGSTNASQVKNAAEQRIPRRIIEKWETLVRSHITENPFTESESNKVTAWPQIAYGSTLLVAVVSENYLFAFQLGDGDILIVSDRSDDTSYLIEKDQSLIANETTSLCQKDAFKHFRHRFHFFEDRPPAMVLLCTDGYSNSFASPAGFLQAGSDFLHLLQTTGPDSLRANLPGWLEEATREGSGDDITLGIIYRTKPQLSVCLDANLARESENSQAGDREAAEFAEFPDSTHADSASNIGVSGGVELTPVPREDLLRPANGMALNAKPADDECS